MHPDPKAFRYVPVDKGTVVSKMEMIYSQLVQGKDGQAVNSIVIRSQVPQMKVWSERQWIEVETEIDKKWFGQMQVTLMYLYRCKKFLEIAKFNRKLNTPKARKVMQNYMAALKKFKEMIDNPTRVDRNKLSTLKRKRRDWLKVMRKKEKERLEKERYEKRRAR